MARSSDTGALSQHASFTYLNALAHTSAYEETQLRPSFILAIILTAFFGFYTILTAVATHILLRKGTTTRRRSAMLPALLTMWAFTTAHWLASVIVAFNVYQSLRGHTLEMVAWAQDAVACSSSGFSSSGNASHIATAASCSIEVVGQSLPSFNRGTLAPRECAGTVAIAFNVALGDSIVWWRAWVIWRERRTILWAGVVLVLATCVGSVMNIKEACHGKGEFEISSASDPSDTSLSLGSLYGQYGWGFGTAALTLSTGLAATSLIAYKAWEHRAMVKAHLRKGTRRTQVERVMLLLVESGALYCGLWVFMIIYQLVSLSLGASTFAYGLYYTVGGCVVPLIGMYPTLVIIVCAVDRSYCEETFTQVRHGQGASET